MIYARVPNKLCSFGLHLWRGIDFYTTSFLLFLFFYMHYIKDLLTSSVILEASNHDCERPPLIQACKRLQITSHDACSRYLTFGFMFSLTIIVKFAFKIKEYVDELSFCRFSISLLWGSVLSV